MKFLQVFGVSLHHSSISISPLLVSRITLPDVGGYWLYILVDIFILLGLLYRVVKKNIYNLLILF